MLWNQSFRKFLSSSSSVPPCKGTRFISSLSSTVVTHLPCRPRAATDVIINPRGCWAARLGTRCVENNLALYKKKKKTTTGRTWSHSWDGAGGHIPSRPVSKASKHKGGDGEAPTKGPSAASSFHAGQYKSTRFPVKTRCTSSPRPLLCFIVTITPWQRPHFLSLLRNSILSQGRTTTKQGVAESTGRHVGTFGFWKTWIWKKIKDEWWSVMEPAAVCIPNIVLGGSKTW